MADALSRDTPQEDEWSLPRNEFRRLQSVHGEVLQIDLLATPLNSKKLSYFCPFEFPAAAGKDVYAQNLNQFTQIYAFPPPTQAALFLEFLHSYQGGGLLILPDLSALRVLLPERDLVVPIPLERPPGQMVQGSWVPHPNGLEAFRAWTFSKKRLAQSLDQR